MKMNNLLKTVLITALTALAVSCGGGRGSDSTSAATWDPDQGDAAMMVETAEVTTGRLFGSIESAGTIAGVNEVQLVAESQGVVQSVEVLLGQSVSRGEVIARLDDSIARLSMQEALAAWENAEIDLNAVQNLFERGNASKIELVRAQSAERGARARYEQALKVLEDRTITSPIEGRVAWIDEGVSTGNYINPGTRLARIVDDSAYSLDLHIGERQIGLLAPGAEALIRVAAAGDMSFPGVVTEVAAGSDPSTASFRVVIEFDGDRELLKSGMSAKVSIDTNREKEVLLVPTAALLRGEEENAVFLATSGSAVEREVRIGRRLGGMAEVLSGLDAGDKVVVSGTTRLSDGAPIEFEQQG